MSTKDKGLTEKQLRIRQALRSSKSTRRKPPPVSLAGPKPEAKP